MELSALLHRGEPARLRELGKLFGYDDRSRAELLSALEEELPYCQIDDEGDCIGIDGALFVAADLVADLGTLELLLETPWERAEPNGVLHTYKVLPGVEELSLRKARLLLGMLAVATFGEAELPIPPGLDADRFPGVLESAVTRTGRPSERPRNSQSPSAPPRKRMPSIPPGFSPSLDSQRPPPGSVPPGARAEKKAPADWRLVEHVLTLPRESLVAAAFALRERDLEETSVCVGAGRRALLPTDALEVTERLWSDHSDSIPPPSSSDARGSALKRIAKSLCFYGISEAEGAEVLAVAAALGRFPSFWSQQKPPPVTALTVELSETDFALQPLVVELLFEVFYRERYPDVSTLSSAFGLSPA